MQQDRYASCIKTEHDTHFEQKKQSTVQGTDCVLLWNKFHDLQPTQTVPYMLPNVGVRTLFTVSVWSGRNF